jgi:alkylation response protein AidB-like acyl-CoA dehydrogenase
MRDGVDDQAWGAVTLAYLAGVSTVPSAVPSRNARTREQFGAPLAALPAVQARLADAALARNGLVLCAWSAATSSAGFPGDALAWAGAACREVTVHVQQVHGGIGFALEGGIHRYYRRGGSCSNPAAALQTTGERSSHIRLKGQLVGSGAQP